MGKGPLPVSPLAPPEGLPPLPDLDQVRIETGRIGLKYQDRDDLLLIGFPPGTRVAGMVTRSTTRAAPCDWCAGILTRAETEREGRALLVMAGNANAATGAAGRASTAEMVAAAAARLGVSADAVLVASTGVIGEPIAEGRISAAMPGLRQAGFAAAAAAIMTTDTFPKAAVATVQGATVVGFAKGSGMIMPDMATMLAFVVTDAAPVGASLDAIARPAIDRTLNRISVDGDTSTNDTALVFATGARPVPAADLAVALEQVLASLARQITADGEGAQKLIRIRISGAPDEGAALQVARSIANSPLVKTAIAGGDANWGRIIMAIGKSGAPAVLDRIAIAIGGVAVARDGQRVAGYQEAPVAAHLTGREILLEVDLGLGDAAVEMLTCDLTHGYIDINADYRS